PLKSPLDGNELMEIFGRGPGPWLRPIKDHLLSLVIDGALAPDDKEEAVKIARAMLDKGVYYPHTDRHKSVAKDMLMTKAHKKSKRHRRHNRRLRVITARCAGACNTWAPVLMVEVRPTLCVIGDRNALINANSSKRK